MEPRYVVTECDGEYVLVSQASGWAQIVGTYATLAEARERLDQHGRDHHVRVDRGLHQGQRH